MSWDVWLEIDTGNGDVLTSEDRNMTSNVGAMYHKAGLDGFGQTLNRMSAKEAAIVLKPVVDSMERNPEVYKQLNPPNGLGDYDSALEFITWVYRMCLLHPKACVRVSY